MNKEGEPQHGSAQEGGEKWPIGRAILAHIRENINEQGAPFAGDEGEDVFRSLYLTDRDGCIPDNLLGEDILLDIRSLYYFVVDGVRSEIEKRLKPAGFMWIVVDPSYEDSTTAVLMTDERVLLVETSKAWNFVWDSEEAMAEELEEWYARATRPLAPGRRAERRPVEGEQFSVLLTTERLLWVRAGGGTEALEKARLWRSNEDDPDAQLEYEEIIGKHIDRLVAEPEAGSDATVREPESEDAGPPPGVA